MRLWWQGRRPSASAPAPAPTRPAWQDLPPVQRTVTPTDPVAPAERLTRALTSWRDPRFIAPLAHLVDPSGPSGTVTGLADAVPQPLAGAAAGELPAPVAASDRRRFGALVRGRTLQGFVQRMTGRSDPTEAGGALAPVGRPEVREGEGPGIPTVAETADGTAAEPVTPIERLDRPVTPLQRLLCAVDAPLPPPSKPIRAPAVDHAPTARPVSSWVGQPSGLVVQRDSDQGGTSTAPATPNGIVGSAASPGDEVLDPPVAPTAPRVTEIERAGPESGSGRTTAMDRGGTPPDLHQHPVLGITPDAESSSGGAAVSEASVPGTGPANVHPAVQREPESERPTPREPDVGDTGTRTRSHPVSGHALPIAPPGEEEAASAPETIVLAPVLPAAPAVAARPAVPEPGAVQRTTGGVNAPLLGVPSGSRSEASPQVTSRALAGPALPGPDRSPASDMARASQPAASGSAGHTAGGTPPPRQATAPAPPSADPLRHRALAGDPARSVPTPAGTDVPDGTRQVQRSVPAPAEGLVAPLLRAGMQEVGPGPGPGREPRPDAHDAERAPDTTPPGAPAGRRAGTPSAVLPDLAAVGRVLGPTEEPRPLLVARTVAEDPDGTGGPPRESAAGGAGEWTPSSAAVPAAGPGIFERAVGPEGAAAFLPAPGPPARIRRPGLGPPVADPVSIQPLTVEPPSGSPGSSKRRSGEDETDHTVVSIGASQPPRVMGAEAPAGLPQVVGQPSDRPSVRAVSGSAPPTGRTRLVVGEPLQRSAGPIGLPDPAAASRPATTGSSSSRSSWSSVAASPGSGPGRPAAVQRMTELPGGSSGGTGSVAGQNGAAGGSPSHPLAEEATAQRQAAPDDGNVAAAPTVAPVAPGSAAPPGDTTATPGVPSGAALDELVRRLFDPLSARLKDELRLDRERAGVVTDLRH